LNEAPAASRGCRESVVNAGRVERESVGLRNASVDSDGLVSALARVRSGLPRVLRLRTFSGAEDGG